MKACLLAAPAPIETQPLQYKDAPAPDRLEAGEVLIRVRACGVCRTDLHVIEGELAPRKSPVIPGHQVVGVVERTGAAGTRETARVHVGDRVGAAWLRETCGRCEFCRSQRENLCESASFNGYTADGGYAEYMVAPEAFLYRIPEGFADLKAAPLLCAGIIGFRCLRAAGMVSRHTGEARVVGLYGFGAAAHVAIQVARFWGARVLAFTRDLRHQKLALELGAVWAGGGLDVSPEKLDAAILFAPAGELVPAALANLKKGGTVVLGGIHMSPVPSMPYQLLYHERVIRSVANNTRQDGEDFLALAAKIPIETRVETFPLADANRALNALKNDAIRGAAVLLPS